MKDLRKQKCDYPKQIDYFCKEAEKNGLEVEYIKQYNSKSILMIIRKNSKMKVEFQHIVNNGEKYFKLIYDTFKFYEEYYCKDNIVDL